MTFTTRVTFLKPDPSRMLIQIYAFLKKKIPVYNATLWKSQQSHTDSPLPKLECSQEISPGASLTAQVVKNLPAMQDTLHPWVGKIPLEKEMEIFPKLRCNRLRTRLLTDPQR